jgi:hypothetical protein
VGLSKLDRVTIPLPSTYGKIFNGIFVELS